MSVEVRLLKRLDGFTLNAEWRMGNELTVLFGYSGAGKSLTLRMLAGLIYPDEGRIRLGDKILFDSKGGIDIPPRKRRAGYVFQDSALFPHMTVRENVRYGMPHAPKDERSLRAEEMMRALGIIEHSKKYPSEISGGQRQRVALARALVGRPEMLLLDEPFGALDHPVRVQMRKLVMDLRRELRIPAVLITHDLQEALQMADRIVVYSGGRAIQSGTPEEIVDVPASREVRALFRIPEESSAPQLSLN